MSLRWVMKINPWCSVRFAVVTTTTSVACSKMTLTRPSLLVCQSVRPKQTHSANLRRTCQRQWWQDLVFVWPWASWSSLWPYAWRWFTKGRSCSTQGSKDQRLPSAMLQDFAPVSDSQVLLVILSSRTISTEPFVCPSTTDLIYRCKCT